MTTKLRLLSNEVYKPAKQDIGFILTLPYFKGYVATFAAVTHSLTFQQADDIQMKVSRGFS